MAKHSWFSRFTRRWGQAISHHSRSLRSRRRAARKLHGSFNLFEPLENRVLFSTAPTLEAISNVTVQHSSPLIVGLDGDDADGDNLTYSVQLSGAGATNLTAEILGANDGVSYNRSLVLDVTYKLGNTTYTGTMVFELFEDLVPEATARIIEMVEAGYYDDLTFHRVINDFVIQTGTYEYDSGYTAKSSSYTTFDDEFSDDLQHNATGLLSWAKQSYTINSTSYSIDDSASTNFFITDYNASNSDSVQALRNLDYNFSIFGKIVEGADVLQAITQVTVGTNNGLPNSPTSPVTITDARIETIEQNASLILKVGDGYTAGQEVTVTVTATDSNGDTTTETFTVTLDDDGLGNVTDDTAKTVYYNHDTSAWSSTGNIYNASPYFSQLDDIYVAYGTNNFTIAGTTTDADGMANVVLTEIYNSTEYVTEDDETATIAIFDSDYIAIPDPADYTTQEDYDDAMENYYLSWQRYVLTAEYDPTEFDLPDGLTYTSLASTSNKITSGTYNSTTGEFTFTIGITRTDATLVGVYQIFLVSYNVIESMKLFVGNQPTTYKTTSSYDTQVLTIVLRPPTPNAVTVSGLTNGYVTDNTPTVTVTGLTNGAALKILDENDNVVGQLASVTGTSAQVDVSALGEGSHTLRAVQIVNDAESEAASVTFTVDSVAPQAFSDVNFTPATSGVLYTYDVGHPQEDDSNITFSLNPANKPAGMTINSDTAEISWNTPTDTHYPSVTFDIIATDQAGNTTTQSVTIEVNSFVDLSGRVINDSTGQGVEGVLVFADINGNNILDETDIVDTTSATGSYSLQNVPAGTVILHQVMTDGFEQQTPGNTRLTMVQVISDGDAATVDNAATTVDGLTWAGALAMSSDGLFVYAASGIGSASTSDDGIAVFARNTNDGTLTFVQFLDGIAALDDPNSIVVTPDGRHVYVTCDNAGSDGIIIFSRDQDTGLLTHVGSIVDGGTDAAGNIVNNISGSVKVIVSDNDEFVYVASRFDDSISVFDRDRNTGNLTLIQELVDGTILNGAGQMTLSPNGDFLYVGLFEGLAVYAVNTSTGLLTHVQDVDDDSLLSDMREIAITPDGNYLYAASNVDNALNIFSRNTTTGEITLQSTIGTYDNPSGLTISPDGSKLYMTAISEDQLNIFEIQSDGSLVISQSLEEGDLDDLSQTLEGLDGPVTLLLDPDGHDVYVASRTSNAISVFSDRTRTWAGIPYVRQVTPTSNNHTDINFVNDEVTVDVDDVQYNTLNYDADKPTTQDNNAPTTWSQQRSTINDITITFTRDLLDVDKTAITLTRVFDVDGNATSEVVALDVNDIAFDGDTLIISNLDLVDGVYEIVISTDFNAAMNSEYSTYFHQLLGDLNGDRLFNAVDLASMVYWRQLAADTNNFGYVPGYLDVRDTSGLANSDGRVDNYDFAAFVAAYGSHIPLDAVPIPDIILSALPNATPVTSAQLAYTAPKTATLQLAWSDDEEEGSDITLLDQLDDPNLILQMIESE
jgi:6-phosphogluconolactonase (cycloisomerase 2 family)/cyclophilin family peptidyl-prolyl cis-trans isomerase